MRPIEVYTQLNKEEQMDHCPRDKRQVRNKKIEVAKAEHMTGNGEGVVHQNNFADQIIQLTNLIRTDGFIRRMYQGKNGVPSIVLYTDQNFHLMKNMCCDGERTTVLGVDKTFNLGPVFVTATVFKHLALYRLGTTNHPLMLGPIFLHSTSDFEAFYSFFGHISTCLDSSNKACLVVGADDEKAMIKAMKECMPQATILACTRQCTSTEFRRFPSKQGSGSGGESQVVKPGIWGRRYREFRRPHQLRGESGSAS